jgi:hypothetical protein
MTILGIDPGVAGAIARLWIAGELDTLIVFDMPTLNISGKGRKRQRLDIDALHRWLIDSGSVDHAFIETAQAMPGQGSVSMFHYGVTYGILLALLTSHHIPYTEVHPRRWKSVMLDGLNKSSKDASRLRAKQLWPGVSYFDFKKDEHRAEAALIAEFGRRQLNVAPEHEGA